jgi:radical SAM protein with 4Fe4S-binding SPASM domain
MSPQWGQHFRKMFQMPDFSGKSKPGIYHYRREAEGNVTRFHLRIEEDGSGLLLANSSVAAKLSASGVTIAKMLLDEKSDDEIQDEIHKRFRDVYENQLNPDIERLKIFIETLANPIDNYPIFNLNDPAVSTPHSLLAPFHAQLPVMPADKIIVLLDQLWKSGIVHVTFSATSESISRDCLRNVERAEDVGMISGVRGTGTWLQTPELLQRLAVAGVDYITVPLVSSNSEKHDSLFGPADHANAAATIAECLRLEVCPVVEIPLFKENESDLEPLVKILEDRGVRNVQYYAIASTHQSSGLNGTQIIQAAVNVEELSHHSAVRYVWQAPVSARGEFRKLLEHGPRSAGDVSICVEQDGSVFPARGEKVAAGNLLTQPFSHIWDSEVFRKYRERVETPTRCDICPGLAICAADCPADPRGWASE